MTMTPLLDVLEQSYQCHLELKTLAEQKKAAIIANDVDALSRFMKSESKMLSQIDALEASREEMCRAYLQQQGFMPATKNVTLKTIIGVTHQAEWKMKLSSYHEKLTKVLEELQALNQLNQQLIKQSLDYINFSLDVMTDDGSDALTYQRPASAAKMKQRQYSAFDTRA